MGLRQGGGGAFLDRKGLGALGAMAQSRDALVLQPVA
jgi:hypothetical protein